MKNETMTKITATSLIGLVISLICSIFVFETGIEIDVNIFKGVFTLVVLFIFISVDQIIEKELFNCVIMPLPKNSDDFLKIGIKALKENGLLVIYLASSQNKAEGKIKELEKKGFTLKDFKRGAEIAPNEYRFTIIANKNRNLN